MAVFHYASGGPGDHPMVGDRPVAQQRRLPGREGRFNITVQDSFVMGELTERGECVVAQVIPEGIVPQLRTGRLEYMYDGKVPWQLYREICDCDHKGMMTNLFVAREEWYDQNPEQAAAFLELWERGVQLWHENQEEIINLYPQHFSVEAEEDIEWMVEFMAGETTGGRFGLHGPGVDRRGSQVL